VNLRLTLGHHRTTEVAGMVMLNRPNTLLKTKYNQVFCIGNHTMLANLTERVTDQEPICQCMYNVYLFTFTLCYILCSYPPRMNSRKLKPSSSLHWSIISCM